MSILEWLKDQANRVLARYCAAVLRRAARSVGDSVSFHAHWHHFAIPPLIFGDGNIDVGSRVRFFGKVHLVCGRRVNPDATIRIGDDVLIGDNVSFRCLSGIDIGSRSVISSGVRIFDQNGHPLSPELRRKGWDGGAFVPAEEVKPVVIEENVWLGENSHIHPGVTIGENSIVSAGSSVTKNVPPNVVVMGSPARICAWLSEKSGEAAL